MELTQLRNPHVAAMAEASETNDAAAIAEALTTKPRLRWVALSPAEEYAMRRGETEPLSDALAALICSRKTTATVTMRGVVVEHPDFFGKRRFWHPDSPICNRIGAGEPMKVIAVWNRLIPDRIHLMTREGAYLETLPAEVLPDALNEEEMTESLAEHRRVHRRVAKHLRKLHAEDSQLQLKAAEHNTAETLRIVGSFPNAAAAPPKRATKPAAEESPLVTAMRDGGEEVGRGIARVKRSRAIADAHFDREVAPQRSTEPAHAKTYDPFDL